MSSSLAPIHFWLYNKIQIQEALIRTIAQTAKDKGFLRDTEQFICELLPELSAAIDLKNIHGWLQEKIASSEKRLACLVTEILSEDENRLTAVLETAEAFGKKYAIPPQSGAHEAYKALTGTLLSGMPCDKIEEVIENTPDYAAWKNTADMHAPYWKEINGNPVHYWKIRAVFIRGLLSETDLSFSENGETFEIKQ